MPTTERRRVRSSDNQGGFISGFFDAYQEVQSAKRESEYKIAEANEKLKGELYKGIIMQKLKNQSNPMHPESAQQKFFQNRLRREGPLADMIGMTEDPNQPFEVSMPGDQVVQTPRGSLATKDVSPDSKQAMLAFMTAYDRKVQSGGKVHPVATKLYEKMKAKVNQGQFGKEETEKNQKPIPASVYTDISYRAKKNAEQVAKKRGWFAKPTPEDISSEMYKLISQYRGTGSSSAPESKYTIGQKVNYQGKAYTVKGIRDDGSLELE